jgi:hypothetical protein
MQRAVNIHEIAEGKVFRLCWTSNGIVTLTNGRGEVYEGNEHQG